MNSTDLATKTASKRSKSQEMGLNSTLINVKKIQGIFLYQRLTQNYMFDESSLMIYSLGCIKFQKSFISNVKFLKKGPEPT